MICIQYVYNLNKMLMLPKNIFNFEPLKLQGYGKLNSFEKKLLAANYKIQEILPKFCDLKVSAVTKITFSKTSSKAI